MKSMMFLATIICICGCDVSDDGYAEECNCAVASDSPDEDPENTAPNALPEESSDENSQDPDLIIGIGGMEGYDETAADHTWKDLATGYEWSASFGEKRLDTRLHAIKYCKNLTVNGKSDWELATIDELRTLVRRCPASAAGGACELSTGDALIWTLEQCAGCLDSQTFNDGWFATPELINYGGVSTVLSASFANEAFGGYWQISFHSGYINHSPDLYASGYLCIR